MSALIQSKITKVSLEGTQRVSKDQLPTYQKAYCLEQGNRCQNSSLNLTNVSAYGFVLQSIDPYCEQVEKKRLV